MKIRDYLMANGITHRQFADLMGLTEGMISHYVCGRHGIPPDRVLQIERVTGGAVPREELLPELFDGFVRVG